MFRSLRPRDDHFTDSTPQQIVLSAGKNKFREEVTLQELYGSSFDVAQKICIVEALPKNAVQVSNDWTKRLESFSKNKEGTSMSFRAAKVAIKDAPSMAHAVARPEHHLIRSVDFPCEVTFSGDNILGDFMPNVQISTSVYNLDDQDLHWIAALNMERRAHRMDSVDENDIRRSLEYYERAWFRLTRAPKKWCARQVELLTPNSSVCDVCKDSDTSLDNVIVICDGCHMSVHQDCYSIPLLPEGSWFCIKCRSMDGDARCCLCPWSTGLLKPTTDVRNPWCHLVCGLFLGTEIGFDQSRAIIDTLRVLPARYKLTCQYCQQKIGAPIQCSFKSCYTAYHVNCAHHVGCSIDWKNHTSYCLKHSEASANRIVPKLNAIVNVEAVEAEYSVLRESHKHFSNPVAPRHILNAIYSTDVFSSFEDMERAELLEIIGRYWSMKKSRVRGAPLIRSLEIEPWSHSHSASNLISMMQTRMSLLKSLRKAAYLLNAVLEREKLRKLSLMYSRDMLDIILLPRRTIFMIALSIVRSFDRYQFFEHLVDAEFVPDYYQVIDRPFCISMIQENIVNFRYRSIDDLKEHVDLICDNAMYYNKPDTIYYTEAAAMKHGFEQSYLKLTKSLQTVESDKFIEFQRSCLEDLKENL